MVEISVRKCSIKHRRFWNEMAVLEENDCVKRTRDWTWRREKPETPKQNGTQVGARFWECNIFAHIYVAKKCQCHIIFWCAEYHEGTTVKHKFIEALPVYSVIATTTSKVSNAFSSKVCVCVFVCGNVSVTVFVENVNLCAVVLAVDWWFARCNSHDAATIGMHHSATTIVIIMRASALTIQ